MKVFKYKDQEYIRVIPVKKLFNSTMVHEVVNRGDIFAVNLRTYELTIVPGGVVPEWKHRWLIKETGLYDSTFYCEYCGAVHSISADDPNSQLPKYGCIAK